MWGGACGAGLPAWFTASQCARAKGAGNTLSLVPSRNSDAREILLRRLSPEYADGTLTQSM